MKKHFLTLAILTALTACGSDDDTQTIDPASADISGDFSATATKLTDPTGRLIVADPNPGESLVYPATITGKFGSFDINAAGDWQYTLDDTNEQVIALVSSDMDPLVEDPFTIKTADGTTAQVAVTVEGVDVPAIVSGALTFSVFYDDGNASAQVRVSDANPAEAFFAPNQTPTASYGAVTFDSDTGIWTYDLDESKTDVQALNYTEETDTPPTLDDTFVITTLDGTEATVTITIKGSQLVPAVIEGLPVDENGVSMARVNVNSTDTTGDLTVSDPNFGQAKFQVQDDVATSYGTFSIDETGTWTYKLDNANAEVIALKGDGTAPDPLLDSVKVMSIDGTAVDIPIMVDGLVGGNLTAEVGTDKDGKLAINIPAEAYEMGKAVFKLNYPEASSKDAKIILHGSKYKGSELNRTMIAMVLRSNGEIKLYNGTSGTGTFVIDQTHTAGTWTDIEMTWDASQTARDANSGHASVSIKINGTPVSAASGEISGEFFPSFTVSSALGLMSSAQTFEVQSKGASSVYIDDLTIYSDTSGNTQAFSETFDNLPEGGALMVDYTDDTNTKEVLISPVAKP